MLIHKLHLTAGRQVPEIFILDPLEKIPDMSGNSYMFLPLLQKYTAFWTDNFCRADGFLQHGEQLDFLIARSFSFGRHYIMTPIVLIHKRTNKINVSHGFCSHSDDSFCINYIKRSIA